MFMLTETGFFLHGDPGIVADMLTGTGQTVEKGCFAGIGITGKGDIDFIGHQEI